MKEKIEKMFAVLVAIVGLWYLPFACDKMASQSTYYSARGFELFMLCMFAIFAGVIAIIHEVSNG